MFYDLKFSEMVHPGSTLMTGMFPVFCGLTCLPKEHPHMFFPGIQNDCDLSQI